MAISYKIKLAAKIALLNLNANRVRSLLTMLGIIIGISSVISIVSLGAGAQSLFTNALKNLGTNSISVLPGNSNDDGPPASALGIFVETLTVEDSEAIAELPNVTGVLPYSNGTGEAVFLTRYTSASYSGVTANYPEIENHSLETGRFFSEQEVKNYENVAVLGDELVDTLFPLSEPIGQTIKIQNENFEVIGVLERKGSILFENLDNRIYVPITVAHSKLLGSSHLDVLRIKVSSEDLVEPTKDAVRNLLRYRHNIQDPNNDDFSVRSVTQALDIFVGITNGMRFFLAVIAAISLVIGGISVTNIMIMTVTERKREIGLKKAVGATSQQIRNQFLIETMVITGLGGIIGIICGSLFSLFVSILMNYFEYNWTFKVSILSITIAFLSSVLIGLVFGVYPAKKAAKLNPIESLRYE